LQEWVDVVDIEQSIRELRVALIEQSEMTRAETDALTTAVRNPFLLRGSFAMGQQFVVFGDERGSSIPRVLWCIGINEKAQATSIDRGH
jgi:hypothetical protein